MKDTGERCILGSSSPQLEKEHLDRYKFAKDFIQKDSIVLDIACGSGYGTKYLSSAKPKVIYGVDISDEAIDYAQKNNSSKNIKYIKGSATNLDMFEDNSFDTVVSFETIEHLEGYKEFLKEIHRILKPGCVFVISTPNKKYSSPYTKKPINPFHVIEFYPQQFEKLILKNFSEVKFYGQDLQSVFKNIKRFIVNIFPKSIRQSIIPSTIRDSYNLNQLSGINSSSPDKSRFFIAVCKK